MDELKAPVNELARSLRPLCRHRGMGRVSGPMRTGRRIGCGACVTNLAGEHHGVRCRRHRAGSLSQALRTGAAHSADFQPQGDDSFLALLRVVAASVANDYFRRLLSEKRGGKVVTMVLDEESSSVVPVASEKTRRFSGPFCFPSSITSCVRPLDDRGTRSNYLLALLLARPHRR